MKGILYFVSILLIILILTGIPNHLGLQYSFDYSNLLSIFVTAVVGLYVASEIPKRINSNRAEVDIIIKKIESIINNYNELFQFISIHSRNSSLEFREITNFTDQNTTELYVFQRLLCHCEIEKDLKAEIDKLIRQDKALRQLVSNSGVTSDGLVIYEAQEVSAIQTSVKEMEDILWVCVFKINRN